MEKYRALVVREDENGSFSKGVELVDCDFLPENDVLIKVKYAALNYKDALSASGHKGVSRYYPHTPGVDACGIVEEDKSGRFEPGQAVICTSYDLGMNTKGGFAEYISVPAEWIVPLPEKMSLKEAMIMGTAAYTAALALYKMENNGQRPAMGPIMVTGASGGVGSMAVAILKKAGYEVLASSGKREAVDYLRSIGAKEVLDRSAVNDESGRPLLRSEWAGAIDNVGGNTLVTLLKKCGRNGSVATIGLVDRAEFDMTIYPFILNGVNLLGIDSAETPMNIRTLVWEKLAQEWRPDHLEEMVTICSLEEIPAQMDLILKGKTKGRVLAKMELSTL